MRFAKKFKLDNPIFMDNEFEYWRALNNHYWPEFYLVDRNGIIRKKLLGEVSEGGLRGRRLETVLKKLLDEAAEAPREG